MEALLEVIISSGFGEFISTLLGLVPVIGAAAVLAPFVVDLFKVLGLPDGWAGWANLVINFVFFTIIYFVGSEAEVALDTISGVVIDLAPLFLSIVGAFLGAKEMHGQYLRSGVGRSHSVG